ncbi:MAG: hypothetical protein FWC00_04285 [Firmicutes bacterium]|nr:hypothetical protein [Bacillota bacterium]
MCLENGMGMDGQDIWKRAQEEAMGNLANNYVSGGVWSGFEPNSNNSGFEEAGFPDHAKLQDEINEEAKNLGEL